MRLTPAQNCARIQSRGYDGGITNYVADLRDPYNVILPPASAGCTAVTYAFEVQLPQSNGLPKHVLLLRRASSKCGAVAVR